MTNSARLIRYLPIRSLQRGFTLLELILTIAILAILSAIAIPSFTSTLRAYEADEVQRHIINGFRQAKAESLIRHQNVILCPANDNNLCQKNDSEYLLTFTDHNLNNEFDNAIDTILSKQSLDLDYGQIYLRAGRRDYIKFYADTGLPRGHFGHIKYCPNNGLNTNMYQISINQHGNYRYKSPAFVATGCP